jgi:hypothetical protein
VSQFNQFPNVEPVLGAAVNVTTVPLMNSLTHGVGLEQVRPVGEKVTVPEPFPANVRVRAGPLPLPLPVGHVTSAVIEPVTIAPEEETPDPSLLVSTVADTIVPVPHTCPVTVIRPVELTVII